MPLNGNNYFGDGFGQQFPQQRFPIGMHQMPNFGHNEQQINSNGHFNPFLHNLYQMPQNPHFPPNPYQQFQQQRPFHDQPISNFPEGSQIGINNQNNEKEKLLITEEKLNEAEVYSQNNNDNSLPEFLRGAQPEFIEEYKNIIQETNRSYEEQVALIDQLVNKLDVNKQNLYKEFMKQNDYKVNEHRLRVDKTVSDMSNRAKEQFSEISTILNNKSLPDQQRWQQVLQIYNKMEPELRNEFEEKFKGFQSAFEN
ncbi:hypothetical protein Mgra_00007097 [Meloidogyne graminicola]|uniref:DUF148 domain-containing protein n=1 Tax=Meloidogyne graminicola TaxID=189291 RepID=A0A8S9ZJI8_9BILA|nr:hypothetical protein Mgra_00007097 [Meloidogyne graminicola]